MSSPVLVAQQLLDFFSALQLVNDGRRITRVAWNNEEVYGILRNDTLSLHKVDGMFPWIVSIGDMEAKDWYALG